MDDRLSRVESAVRDLEQAIGRINQRLAAIERAASVHLAPRDLPDLHDPRDPRDLPDPRDPPDLSVIRGDERDGTLLRERGLKQIRPREAVHVAAER